jgi:hypothetical protein
LKVLVSFVSFSGSQVYATVRCGDDVAPGDHIADLKLVDNNDKAVFVIVENSDSLEKLEIFKRDDVMTEMALTSYKEAVLGQWAMELQGRIVPETMELLRHCRKMHKDEDCVDYDRHYWGKFVRLRNYLGKNTLEDT